MRATDFHMTLKKQDKDMAMMNKSELVLKRIESRAFDLEKVKAVFHKKAASTMAF